LEAHAWREPEWEGKARASIKRRILDARSNDQKLEDDWLKLRTDIDRNMRTDQAIDRGEGRGMNRSAFVTSSIDKIRRPADNGQTQLAARALNYIRDEQALLPKPFITSRNSIWNVLQEAEARIAENPPQQGEETIAEQEGIRAVRNHDLDRLQIFFDGIPSATTREQLKSSGWNWSPSTKAWQRKITNAAEYALTRFLAGQVMEREPEAEHLR
jgi:hypothetical protein